LTALWERLFESAGGGSLASWLASPRGSFAASRLPRAAWPLLAGTLARAAAAQGRSLAVLAPGPERLFNELRPWLAGTPPAHLFAEVHVNFLDRPPAFDEAVARRLEALAGLAVARSAGEPQVLVTSRRALLRPTISPADLDRGTIVLKVKAVADPSELAARLVELGYAREPLVEAPGQFSLRGGILDVFPAAGRAPVRAEFFGEEIETLRVFDVQNQRSVMPVPQVTIRPGKELLLGADRGREAAAAIRAGAGLDRLRADVRAEWDDELERLEAGASFPGVELFSAYLEASLPSALEHLPEEAVVLDFEPDRQVTEVRELSNELDTLVAAEARDGELPPNFRPPIVPLDKVGGAALLRWPRLTVVAADLDEAVDLGWSEVDPIVGRTAALAGIVEASLAGGEAVVLASEQGERVEALLMEAKIQRSPLELDLDLDAELSPGLFHADLDVPHGLAVPAVAFRLYTDSELFGRLRRQVRPTRTGRAGRREPVLTLEFQPDELVVHVDHGVARFNGMRLIEQDGASREYLELEYAEGDRLFVPVESLDRVQKYLGGGEGVPALHRLGTGDWERARKRAKKSAEDVADELLKLYAARQAKPGLSFAPDTAWQSELEASFPYEETEDQLAALAEIKADMEADRPMDRLLCGDVGFGKTELALRAAFKAVMSGRQVALLVPTTVLAQQHYLVFQDRLRNFPVQVDMLSRFRTSDQQDETLAALKAGTVDIVIGTHRLLQRDVRFKKLGLLVIDEEQRFGVMQKERMKRLRTQVDVLSLSATPIPRTLHMAMSGVRDMSVIQTPPEDRQPIKTYVTADDDELVREVLQRELERGGQVYYVHNRVRSIDKAADRIRRLVPHANVAIGHGQMEEDELAAVMTEFMAGEHDVLVCTTIIESGLDLPNVNTLVVERADRFGLSQLYQLRGRVGRGGRRAYAYFLYDPTRSLTEAADKRLDVISGLHELGQGFRIALRDLEIRGAGNLLGTEQHGAIAAVGFEMYLQMLDSAVARLRTGGEEGAVEEALSAPDLNLDLPLDHFIPRSYIRDERLRLGAYRQLAAAEEEEQLESGFKSLRDRYGPPPKQLENLRYSLLVKVLGRRLGLRSIEASGHDIAIRVDPDRLLDTDELQRRFGGSLAVRPNRLLMRRQGPEWQQHLLRLLGLLGELYGNARIPTSV